MDTVKWELKYQRLPGSLQSFFSPRIQAAAQTCSKGKRLFLLYLQDETCPCLLLADRSPNTIPISTIWDWHSPVLISGVQPSQALAGQEITMNTLKPGKEEAWAKPVEISVFPSTCLLQPALERPNLPHWNHSKPWKQSLIHPWCVNFAAGNSEVGGDLFAVSTGVVTATTARGCPRLGWVPPFIPHHEASWRIQIISLWWAWAVQTLPALQEQRELLPAPLSILDLAPPGLWCALRFSKSWGRVWWALGMLTEEQPMVI